jgi:hypothetical protein
MRICSRQMAGFLALLALSVGASFAAYADDAKPHADDQCAAKCDAEADKCTQHAGKDSSKQRECDAAYDMCLKQCS